jgi:hypothetical protein
MRIHFFRRFIIDYSRIQSQTMNSHAFVCDSQAEYGDLQEERRQKIEAQVSINEDSDKCVAIAKDFSPARE